MREIRSLVADLRAFSLRETIAAWLVAGAIFCWFYLLLIIAFGIDWTDC